MQTAGSVLEESTLRTVTHSPEIKRQHSLSGVKACPPIVLQSEGTGYRAKRIIDIMGAGLGLVILGVLFPFIYLGIRISSKGPVIFTQRRTGMNGKDFPCFKFKTMYIREVKPEDGKPVVTKKGDWRIFAFGRLLRKTNIDELPQLINVLRGEMSLVGPRPLPVLECQYWQREIPGFDMRYHNTRPGLTGWAQVTGYRGGTHDPVHMYFRLKRDVRYIEKASLKLDLEIMWRTVKQMVTSKTGAH